jgi:hypothetical protein
VTSTPGARSRQVAPSVNANAAARRQRTNGGRAGALQPASWHAMLQPASNDDTPAETTPACGGQNRCHHHRRCSGDGPGLCDARRYAQQYPSWDALRFAAATAANTPASLTSAHHPLGGLLAYAVYRVVHTLGWSMEALTALQVTSAAGAALAVGGMYAVLRRAGSPLTALATAASLAVSLAFWEVATDGEVYAVASAALCSPGDACCMRRRAARALRRGVSRRRGVPDINSMPS